MAGRVTVIVITAAGVIGVGAFITGQVMDRARPAEDATEECVTAGPAFKSWLSSQSALYGEDLQLRYGIDSVTAECGDITVETLIAEDLTGYELARAACSLLSTAAGEVPVVDSVTVRYGTGRNACFEWPGGPSHFG